MHSLQFFVLGLLSVQYDWECPRKIIKDKIKNYPSRYSFWYTSNLLDELEDGKLNQSWRKRHFLAPIQNLLYWWLPKFPIAWLFNDNFDWTLFMHFQVLFVELFQKDVNFQTSCGMQGNWIISLLERYCLKPLNSKGLYIWGEEDGSFRDLQLLELSLPDSLISEDT